MLPPRAESRTRVILVAGTWGLKREQAWWRPTSDFAEALRRRGAFVPARSFVWTTDLEGVNAQRRHRTWAVAGENLWTYVKNYSAPRDKVVVIAHSHGGQVLAYAARFGARFHTAITLATPIRRDMQDEYERLTAHVGRWVHIYHDGDWTQRLGSWSGLDALRGTRRYVPITAVENRHIPGDHSDLLTEAEWTKHDLWSLIFS